MIASSSIVHEILLGCVLFRYPATWGDFAGNAVLDLDRVRPGDAVIAIAGYVRGFSHALPSQVLSAPDRPIIHHYSYRPCFGKY